MPAARCTRSYATTLPSANRRLASLQLLCLGLASLPTPPRLPRFPQPGRSFCIEVTRTLVELGVPFVYYRVDQMADGAQVWLLCGQLCLVHLFGGPPARLYEESQAAAQQHAAFWPAQLASAAPATLHTTWQLHEELKRMTGQKTVP